MIDPEMQLWRAVERGQELRRDAEHSRLVARARPRRSLLLRLRLGSVTVLIEREPGAYPAPRSVSRPT